MAPPNERLREALTLLEEVEYCLTTVREAELDPKRQGMLEFFIFANRINLDHIKRFYYDNPPEAATVSN
jgi:hypothetical protein